MPVRKFRGVEEMPDTIWREPGDPELFRAMEATWDLARRTVQPTFPPGIYKHRSVEEAEALRARWERDRVLARREASRIGRDGAE